MIIDALKNFVVEKYDLEDLVEFSAFARMVDAEFDVLGVDKPEWFPVKVKELRRAIKVEVQGRIEKLVREKEARISALRTPTEKREALQAELDKLKAKLSQD